MNDTGRQAEALGRLLGAFPGIGGAHVNLIPLNPTDGFDGGASHPPRLRELRRTAPGPRRHRDDSPQSGHRDRRRLRSAAIAGVDASRPVEIGHNGFVNQWKWVNQFQPQTLYMATILCYVDAVFGLLFGFVATSILAGLLTIIALGAGGFGIANEKKWGYAVAVGGAVLQVVMLFAVFGSSVLHVDRDHQPPVRRRARGPPAAPHEPRVPAHLVQVGTWSARRGARSRPG